ncbi:biotin--[acetyl-CoA-carboxylase] ligase [Urechidicola croceus]|uniref:Biotin--[acetyl-CoA-carboxylase] ligase n=1 Tax=Urechidicola croceus TaxID=1850246 RepID=A0A1D8PBD4_9FLAO|nr:biotin--[acetyl-CoA-carboxylase] ligase [Urechidicola croceus]AOW21878.1 biotin--[acetyl-CoA-carboxylase] ligase [Urechidicola croceus]
MKIIKLDATESTNTFLRELCHVDAIDNFTVVTAKKQTNGRGQMESSWSSNSGENLTFSVLVKFLDIELVDQFYISKAVALSISDVLTSKLTTKVLVKWPNDILAEHKKICGVLIENSVKKARINHSIIGVGLNVNQVVFENLPNATSMKLISKEKYDLDKLLRQIVEILKKYIEIINQKDFHLIDKLYLDRLYKFNTPAMYKDVISGELFMGKLVDVTKEGLLKIELENEKTHKFNLKEIEFMR